MSLISKFASKYLRSNQSNKPSESVSRQPGRDVRDSIQTKEGKCITSTGTFTLLIMLLVLPMLVGSNAYATDDSITVTIDDSTLDLNIDPRSTAGNFNKSSIAPYQLPLPIALAIH